MTRDELIHVVAALLYATHAKSGDKMDPLEALSMATVALDAVQDVDAALEDSAKGKVI